MNKKNSEERNKIEWISSLRKQGLSVRKVPDALLSEYYDYLIDNIEENDKKIQESGLSEFIIPDIELPQIGLSDAELRDMGLNIDSDSI